MREVPVNLPVTRNPEGMARKKMKRDIRGEERDEESAARVGATMLKLLSSDPIVR